MNSNLVVTGLAVLLGLIFVNIHLNHRSSNMASLKESLIYLHLEENWNAP